MLMARRGRIHVQRTLGRAGGERLIRIGKLLGLLGLCLAAAATVALAFYTLLRVFEA
jgi:hypothetical protein